MRKILAEEPGATALTFVIIGILVLAWVAFLAPTLLRSRNNQVRSDSVGDFHHRLRALGRTNGHRWHGRTRSTSQPILGPVRQAPGAMSPAQRRRRDVLLILAGLVVVTFLAAVALRSAPVIALQLLADAALAGYVYLLVQHRQRSDGTRGHQRLAPRRDAEPYPLYPAYSMPEIDLRPRAAPQLVPLRQTASR